jgi:hypothetical protein
MKLKWVSKNWRNIKLFHLHSMQSFLEQDQWHFARAIPKKMVHWSLQKHVPCFCNWGPLVEWTNIVQFVMHRRGFCHTTSNWCMNTSHQCLWKPWNNWYFQCWDQIVTPPFPFVMMSFGPFVGYYKGTINKSIWNGWWTTIWISLHILQIL